MYILRYIDIWNLDFAVTLQFYSIFWFHLFTQINCCFIFFLNENFVWNSTSSICILKENYVNIPVLFWLQICFFFRSSAVNIFLGDCHCIKPTWLLCAIFYSIEFLVVLFCSKLFQEIRLRNGNKSKFNDTKCVLIFMLFSFGNRSISEQLKLILLQNRHLEQNNRQIGLIAIEKDRIWRNKKKWHMIVIVTKLILSFCGFFVVSFYLVDIASHISRYVEIAVALCRQLYVSSKTN